MHKILLELAATTAAALIAVHGVAAQPAPPPPPGFPDYVHLLDDAYNRHDIVAYGDLFRNDVKVYLDGSLIASDRPAYLTRIQAEFKQNLHVSTLSWAQGSQILMFQEMRGCIPEQPDPHTFYHGCGWAVAVRYDLADDHKIASVRILEAEQAWNMHSNSN